MMKEVLPDLIRRTEVKQLHTDGGHGSPEVDEMMHEAQIEHVQTAIRGRKRAEGKLGLEDFHWDVEASADRRREVSCPQGQRVAIHAGRKEHHYLAYFDATICSDCPFRDQCPTKQLKRKSERVLRFSQREVDLALRRKRSREARRGGKNLRAAVEATVRSVKHPFRKGKLPVRGRTRVSMLVIGSAQMTNIRRIHRYEERLREEKRKAEARAKKIKETLEDVFVSFCAFLKVIFSSCQCLRKCQSSCLA